MHTRSVSTFGTRAVISTQGMKAPQVSTWGQLPRCSGAHLQFSPLPANQPKAVHPFSTPFSCKALGLTPAKVLSEKHTVTVPALVYASEMSGLLDAALKGQGRATSWWP